MKAEEEESAPRSTSGSGRTKKKKTGSHNHIGPYVRAWRAGLAFCPVCDAEKTVKLTEREREVDKSSERDLTRTRKVSR